MVCRTKYLAAIVLASFGSLIPSSVSKCCEWDSSAPFAENRSDKKENDSIGSLVRSIIEPWLTKEVGKALGSAPKEVWQVATLSGLIAAVTEVHLDAKKAREYEKDQQLSFDRELMKKLLTQLEAFKRDCSPDDNAPCDLVIVTGRVKVPLPNEMKERRMGFMREQLKRENSETINGDDKDATTVVSGQPGASLNILLEFSGKSKRCEATFEFTFLVFKEGDWKLRKKHIELECQGPDKPWKIRTDLK